MPHRNHYQHRAIDLARSVCEATLSWRCRCCSSNARTCCNPRLPKRSALTFCALKVVLEAQYRNVVHGAQYSTGSCSDYSRPASEHARSRTAVRGVANCKHPGPRLPGSTRVVKIADQRPHVFRLNDSSTLYQLASARESRRRVCRLQRPASLAINVQRAALQAECTVLCTQLAICNIQLPLNIPLLDACEDNTF